MVGLIIFYKVKDCDTNKKWIFLEKTCTFLNIFVKRE